MRCDNFKTMTPDEQKQQLEKQLAQLYLRIADSYKVMSKFKDKLRLDSAQQKIDITLKLVGEVRAQLHARQKEIVDDWVKEWEAQDNRRNST